MEKNLQSCGYTTYVIQKHNLIETIERLSDKEIHFLAYFDRAGDVDSISFH